MRVYILGDIGDIRNGNATLHDADTHEELILSEAQITLSVNQLPTIDFRRTVFGKTYSKQATLERAELVAYSEAPSVKPKIEVDETASCQHTGWVSHAVQGNNRFWCRECDERFTNHPLTYGRVVVKSTQEFKPCPTCGTLIERICMRCHVASYKAPIPT